jgi:anti-sigma B factor antagonist
MDVRTSIVDHLLTVALTGRFDASGAADFKTRAESALTDKIICAVVDMSKVDYISSIGLRALLAAHQKLHAAGGGVYLAGLGEYCQNILRMTGFLGFFPHFATIEEASAEASEKINLKMTSDHWREIPSVSAPRGEFKIIHSEWTRPGRMILSGSPDKTTQAWTPLSEAMFSFGRSFLSLNERKEGQSCGFLSAAGVTAWMPDTGGPPDMLLPGEVTPDLTFDSLFNAAFQGHPNQTVFFRDAGGTGLSAADFAAAVHDALIIRKNVRNKGLTGLSGCFALRTGGGTLTAALSGALIDFKALVPEFQEDAAALRTYDPGLFKGGALAFPHMAMTLSGAPPMPERAVNPAEEIKKAAGEGGLDGVGHLPAGASVVSALISLWRVDEISRRAAEPPAGIPPPPDGIHHTASRKTFMDLYRKNTAR